MNPLNDPTILFFPLGLAAGAMKSNLQVPEALSRFLSLYLLMVLGLKGGFALAKSGLTPDVAAALGCAIGLALLVPALAWQALKRIVPPFDAVGIAATYGSVSAVTFITAMHILEQRGTPAGGYMAAAMALMESPAILLAVAMAGALRLRTAVSAVAVGVGGGAAALTPTTGSFSIGSAVREALTEGGALLLVGSLLIGVVTGDAGAKALSVFTGDLFKGLLAFFLLDMGLLTARQVSGLQGLPRSLLLYGVAGPLLHAAIALGLAHAVGLSVPDATMLMVLAASASYIAVPAVLRHAVPEARPALYIGLSLGLTFPFNLLIGIPLYASIAQRVIGG